MRNIGIERSPRYAIRHALLRLTSISQAWNMDGRHITLLCFEKLRCEIAIRSRSREIRAYAGAKDQSQRPWRKAGYVASLVIMSCYRNSSFKKWQSETATKQLVQKKITPQKTHLERKLKERLHLTITENIETISSLLCGMWARYPQISGPFHVRNDADPV
jgi:hypothetical protein